MRYFCGNKVGEETCGKELRCVKNGMMALVHERYGYRGDLMECPSCKTRMVIANSNGVHREEKYDRDQFTVDVK